MSFNFVRGPLEGVSFFRFAAVAAIFSLSVLIFPVSAEGSQSPSGVGDLPAGGSVSAVEASVSVGDLPSGGCVSAIAVGADSVGGEIVTGQERSEREEADREEVAVGESRNEGMFEGSEGKYGPEDPNSPGFFYTKFSEPGVAESFVAGKRWFPFPDYGDREGWDALFGPERENVIRRGEKFIDYQWKTIPATAYLAFERTGDRTQMEAIERSNREALIALIMGELAEGQGRFIDRIADCVWLASQQFSWILSAHQPSQETGRALPDNREHFIDLGAGRFGSIMAVTHYFFHDEFDELDPSISYAVKTALKEKILDPFLDVENYAAHWWVGLGGGDKVPSLNNWTPWCNSDAILCFLLVEEDQGRLDAALDRSVRSVDMFMRSIQRDGACEEGCSYWEHAAGKLYDWMRILCDASGGALSRFDSERIRKMGEFISRTYIGDGYVVNFADASARAAVPAELVWRYGKAVGSREMTDFALYCLADRDAGRFLYPKIDGGDIFRALEDVRSGAQIRSAADSLNLVLQDVLQDGGDIGAVTESLRAQVPASTWYDETQVCYMRSPGGWFLGAKGGYNAESHNHNDIGTCVLYIRNVPVLVDAGVGTYTKETFSGGRYGIWTMQSGWHNLPVVNGAEQPYGMKYCSKDVACSPEKGRFSVDLADALPEEALCTKWVRSYELATGGRASLTITDSFSLTQRRQADVEHFLVRGEVVLPGGSWQGRRVQEGELLIVCEGVAVRMSFPKSLSASVEERPLEDKRLSSVWGPSLRRLALTSRDDAPARGSYRITLTELPQ